MDPVEEFARLRQEIRVLEDRAEALRAGFLAPGARLRSNRHEVVVKVQERRMFVKDRLPPAIRDDPAYWEVRQTQVVSVRPLGGRRQEDDLVLIEPG